MSARDVIADLRNLAVRTSDMHGGAQRVAWGPIWRDARRWLDDLLGKEGLRADTDAAGNRWITLPGARPETVVIGGHLDSVPDGGWLDGPLCENRKARVQSDNGGSVSSRQSLLNRY